MTENDRYILETLDEIKARCEAEDHMGEVAALIAARHAVEREMARMDIADSKMVIADKADMDELEAYRAAWKELQNTATRQRSCDAAADLMKKGELPDE